MPESLKEWKVAIMSVEQGYEFTEGYIARDCKEKQTIKKRKVQKESDKEDKKNEEGFGKDLE